MEIKILHTQGYSIRRIAKKLGISKNTVKRYLKNSIEEARYSPRAKKPGKLAEFEAYLLKRQQLAHPDKIPATVLFQEILAKGYQGSLDLLRKFLTAHRLIIPVSPVRFETPPGKQMQVDWACFRRKPCKLSALIATLGYSRMTYVEFVDNERIETLLSCLQHAFDYFGGVTQQLLFDNMKTVVLQRHAYAQGCHKFHPKLWDFAKHFGFIPKLCQPYRAQTKGKVERFIRYLRHSFYIPLRTTLAQANMLVDMHTANNEVKTWLLHVANLRIHATLKQRPIDLFEQEKPHLLSLPPTYCNQAMAVTTKDIFLSNSADLVTSTLQHDLSIYQHLLDSTQMEVI